jgi:hypothetical protein
MTLFNKVVEEAVVEVIKPARIVYTPELTADEMAILLLALGSTSGIGTGLYVRLRLGVGITNIENIPETTRNSRGITVIYQDAIDRTVAMME